MLLGSLAVVEDPPVPALADGGHTFRTCAEAQGGLLEHPARLLRLRPAPRPGRRRDRLRVLTPHTSSMRIATGAPSTTPVPSKAATASSSA